MKVLFVHQNFPGQFKNLAIALANQRDTTVVAMTMQDTPTGFWNGVRIVNYRPNRGSSDGIHEWAADFESKIIRGEACLKAALVLKANGFAPDIIISHPGWGESLFLKDVWPNAKLGIYCEYYYNPNGADVGFDPEFPVDYIDSSCKLRLKNLNMDLHLRIADAGISPTKWQADSFPRETRERISVIHDGIDTDTVAPSTAASLTLNGRLTLTKSDEIITFVNRNLEPYRGYHVFMRALPEILRRRPKARILIVGGDGVSYGAKPANGRKWRDIFAEEVLPKMPGEDLARIHFLGMVPYKYFIPLLQISTVHVYLTYPFILSWSLLEAMSAGCAIVASSTQPLQEVIQHGETGRLVQFFDIPMLANEVCQLLDDPESRQYLSQNARAFAQSNYDLKTVCLPRQLEWVSALYNSI